MPNPLRCALLVPFLLALTGCALDRPDRGGLPPEAGPVHIKSPQARCQERGGRWTRVDGVWHCLAR